MYYITGRREPGPRNRRSTRSTCSPAAIRGRAMPSWPGPSSFTSTASPAASRRWRCGANAPTVLRREALEYRVADDGGVPMFGSTVRVQPEKAVLASSSAVREWDANGTNFGYNPARGATARRVRPQRFLSRRRRRRPARRLDGRQTLVAMMLLDEIRGRLAEVFALKNHKIDHVRARRDRLGRRLRRGAGRDGRADRIGHRPGRRPLHSVSRDPRRAAAFRLQRGLGRDQRRGGRAQRCGGRCAASSARPTSSATRRRSSACSSRRRQADASPFDLTLATAGDDFAVMGMHFKLGLYEHQSAGAIQGLIDLLADASAACSTIRRSSARRANHDLRAGLQHHRRPAQARPANAAKRRPLDGLHHRHAAAQGVRSPRAGWDGQDGWQRLMLMPADYAEDDSALFHPLTRELMQRIDFRHGGPEYDRKYPDGIPTTLDIDHATLGTAHQRPGDVPGRPRPQQERTTWDALLDHKFQLLAGPRCRRRQRTGEAFHEPGGKVAAGNRGAVRLQNSRVDLNGLATLSTNSPGRTTIRGHRGQPGCPLMALIRYARWSRLATIRSRPVYLAHARSIERCMASRRSSRHATGSWHLLELHGRLLGLKQSRTRQHPCVSSLRFRTKSSINQQWMHRRVGSRRVAAQAVGMLGGMQSRRSTWVSSKPIFQHRLCDCPHRQR